MTMKDNVKVSIITICYNSAATIENTIKSVLAQTYDNYEYIIVDGKSTDNTLEIVEKYRERFGGRMIVVSEQDNGIYDAMNKGLRMAGGDLIGILNSDDSYETDAVEIMVNALPENAKHMILYGFMRYIENGEVLSVALVHHNSLKYKMINHPTCFVTRDVYADCGYFDTNYRSAGDYEFMIRMSRDKRVTFMPVYRLIANYATGGMSASATGYFEVAKIMRDKGLIGRGKYVYMMLNAHLRKIHGKIRKRKKRS